MLISMSSDETGFLTISVTIEEILSFADLDKAYPCFCFKYLPLLPQFLLKYEEILE